MVSVAVRTQEVAETAMKHSLTARTYRFAARYPINTVLFLNSLFLLPFYLAPFTLRQLMSYVISHVTSTLDADWLQRCNRPRALRCNTCDLLRKIKCVKMRTVFAKIKINNVKIRLKRSFKEYNTLKYAYIYFRDKIRFIRSEQLGYGKH